MRRISIFAATGPVGENTFDRLTRQGGAEVTRTVALTNGRNLARRAEMAPTLRAEIAVGAEQSLLPDRRAALVGSGVVGWWRRPLPAFRTRFAPRLPSPALTMFRAWTIWHGSGWPKSL